jgi:hypothetical protein
MSEVNPYIMGFVSGLAYSAALLARDLREPGHAAQLIHESGYKLKDFKKKAHLVPKYDLLVIIQLFKTESVLK